MRGRKPAGILADPSTLPTTPKAPTWLSKDARTEWRRIMPLLVERRILTEADLGGVENYCTAIGRVREIEREIQAVPALDPKLFRMSDKAMQTARQLAAELGLTPVSRARPAIREEEHEDDLAALDL